MLFANFLTDLLGTLCLGVCLMMGLMTAVAVMGTRFFSRNAQAKSAAIGTGRAFLLMILKGLRKS